MAVNRLAPAVAVTYVKMPNCAVITCKNRSDICYSNNSGVSFHRFPKDPNTKEKWIETTGRGPNWFPPKSSTVCSIHFTEKCFQLLKRGKKIFPWAVPTLKIPVITSSINVEVTMETHNSAKENVSKEINQIPLEVSDIITVDTCVPEEITGDQISLEVTDIFSVGKCVPEAITGNQMQQQVLQGSETGRFVSIEETPRKQKLRKKLEQCQQVMKKQRTQIKSLQRKTSRYRKKICQLEDILAELKGKNLVTCDQAHQLEDCGVKDLIKRYEENQTSTTTKTKYSPALRAFACTLHFYSPKAYEYVQQKFDTCLPHMRTIKKWYESVDASPGFTKESFEAIKLKVQSTEYELLGNLVIDEMSIRQRIEWDGKEMHGYVDICHDGTRGDHLPEAKQALVFMVTAINAPWKIPVGYYLVEGVTGVQRANLVRHCLELLHQTGIIMTSVTFDGCPANLTMAKELGCQLTPDNLKTDFVHPSSGKLVYIFPDPCHMLKLVRNAFEALNVLTDDKNMKIEWRHVKDLNDLQEKETFHLGNKLRRAHINFKNQKMKVRLAAQMFSNSVADALTFCDFKDIDGTATFLKMFNNLFDILNSRHMAQLEFKKPMCNHNKEKNFSFMAEMETYIKSLKVSDGTKVVASSRKTGFVGFLVCIESLKAMYVRLVEQEKKISYFPTYKISQDHLELMFGQIRAHGGCNTNPTARQFKAIYKKLMVKSELRDVSQGNCVSLEKISILTCSSAVENINQTSIQESEQMDSEESAIHDAYEQAIFDEEIEILVSVLSNFGTHAIIYIAGFVVHSLLKKIKCETCAGALSSKERDSEKYAFIKLKDKGGLQYPTEDVIKICKKMEAVIKSTVLSDQKIKVCDKTVKKQLTSKALPHFIGLNLFREIEIHQFEQEPMNNHITLLIKAVMEKYVDTRLHYLTKNLVPKLSRRQVLNKYLHFTGQ